MIYMLTLFSGKDACAGAATASEGDRAGVMANGRTQSVHQGFDGQNDQFSDLQRGYHLWLRICETMVSARTIQRQNSVVTMSDLPDSLIIESHTEI